MASFGSVQKRPTLYGPPLRRALQARASSPNFSFSVDVGAGGALSGALSLTSRQAVRQFPHSPTDGGAAAVHVLAGALSPNFSFCAKSHFLLPSMIRPSGGGHPPFADILTRARAGLGTTTDHGAT